MLSVFYFSFAIIPTYDNASKTTRYCWILENLLHSERVPEKRSTRRHTNIHRIEILSKIANKYTI